MSSLWLHVYWDNCIHSITQLKLIKMKKKIQFQFMFEICNMHTLNGKKKKKDLTSFSQASTISMLEQEYFMH